MHARTKRIPLTKGRFALVDADAYARVGVHKWYASVDSSGNAYARREVTQAVGRQAHVHMHRELIDAPAGVCVDHINGDTLDNRMTNLRLISRFDNLLQYRRKRSDATASTLLGTRFHRPSRNWQSRISIRGTRFNLGYFGSELAAHRAYVRAKNNWNSRGALPERSLG